MTIVLWSVVILKSVASVTLTSIETRKICVVLKNVATLTSILTLTSVGTSMLL